MYSSILITALLAVASIKPCASTGSNSELLLSLNKNLLGSAAAQQGTPNPSVHLALRLSNHHNLNVEAEHLNKLKNNLHNDIQSSLTHNKPVTGLMGLYTMALKSSCYDLNSITFTVSGHTEKLLIHLKKQLEQEKEHITMSHRPLTNYYQLSLGVLAVCVSGVRVNNHVSNKLVKAVEQNHFTHGNNDSIDTYAMAGMALQCVKEAASPGHDVAELVKTLRKIKEKLLASKQDDGHLGNKFSTGLAVQALLAMGVPAAEFSAAVESIRSAARTNSYHNPMSVSQLLPALQHKSYLMVKNKGCLDEDDSLQLDPTVSTAVLPPGAQVQVEVEVKLFSGAVTLYSVDVSKGSSLLDALEALKDKNVGFTFEKESSLWGPFLSTVNGEQARQSDRRYWHLSSNNEALTQGIGDFKIQAAQRITIKNTSY